MKLTKLSNTKFTGTEKETILNTIQSLSDLEVFEDTCKTLELDYIKELSSIEGTELLIKELTGQKIEKIEPKSSEFRDEILELINDLNLTEIELNKKLKTLIKKNNDC